MTQAKANNEYILHSFHLMNTLNARPLFAGCSGIKGNANRISNLKKVTSYKEVDS